MEYLPVETFSAPSDTPALSRGLGLLLCLGNRSPLSLETLAARLALPKASVFRILSTLQQHGMVRKTADKLYEPLWKLQPMMEEKARFQDLLPAAMDRLCKQMGCTIEWYEPAPEGMRLLRQAHPESEVRVLIRPGFVRLWESELEAVTRLGYAFAPKAPSPSPSLVYYPVNGTSSRTPVRESRKSIARARSEKSAVDKYFNGNGIRRYAAAAFRQNTFLGVLALAEPYRFQPSKNDFLSPLIQTLQTL